MGGPSPLAPARSSGAIRALVVGAGETSCLLHLPALAALRDGGRLALAEICDVRLDQAQAAQAQFGFARCGGDAMKALQAPEIEAVYLFGDARMHRDLGLAALESGKHLFVEKPVAPAYADACEMAEAARSRGLVAAGGHNRRFSRSLAEVRRRGAKAGWRYAEASFHKPAFGQPPPFGATSWLTANGIHALDALVFVMGGPPDEMAAAAEGESYSALMRWADGAQAVFLCDNHAGERRETYAFHASGETCRVGDDGLRVAPGGQDGADWPAPFQDGFEAEHAAFLDAIEQGAVPPHALSALAPSLRLAELIETGFRGRIKWPRRTPVRAVEPRRSADGSLLVVNPAGLMSMLAAHPTGRPLVALEQVESSTGPRPDIVAALIGTGPSALSAEALAKLPNLRVAGLVGLSFGRHRPDILLERGVALINASAAYADSVAEFAFGLAVLARRRAFTSDRAMRQGGWGVVPQPGGWRGAAFRTARALRPILARAGAEPALLGLWRRTRPVHGVAAAPIAPARDLQGATVGLVGWGANAEAFATRLLAAGASVSVFTEHASPEALRQAGVVPASLGQVLACDIVSLHRGLTDATRGFLGAAELARLRPGSVFLNVARACLVDPDALLARLRRGDVFACLDVFEDEPPPANHPLRRLPNVFLTSHIAGGSADTRAAAVKEVLDKIESHLGGDPAQAITHERLRAMT